MKKYRPVAPHNQQKLYQQFRRLRDASAPGPWTFVDGSFMVGDAYLVFEEGDPETQLVELVSEHLDTLLDMLDAKFVFFKD